MTLMVVVALAFSATGAAQLAPSPQPLGGGGEVTFRESGGELLVTVTGPRAGLASLCVGDEARVRILHASAAVGEATYERSGDTWTLKAKFDFKLRDGRTGSPTTQERDDYFKTMGWVANASRTGDVKREFRVRLSDVRFLGVTFLTTDEPMTVSHWPVSMEDDCRAVRIAQGYLPETAQFRPATWHRVR